MQQIRIDFDNPGLPQSLGAVEGESQSRIFQVTLYKSGAAYTAPAGAVYIIMYRGFGPQNQGWYDTIEDGAGKRAACTVSGNVVTCELARQALRIPGHLTVVLCVSDAKGYMLKSWPIMADVRNDGYDDTGESEMYFNLSGIAGNYLTQLEKAMTVAETTRNNLTSTSARVQKDIDAKAAAALKTIPESYTELDGSVKQLKEDLKDVNSIIDYNKTAMSYGYNSYVDVGEWENGMIYNGNNIDRIYAIRTKEKVFIDENMMVMDLDPAKFVWQAVQYAPDGTFEKNSTVNSSGGKVFEFDKSKLYRFIIRSTDGTTQITNIKKAKNTIKFFYENDLFNKYAKSDVVNRDIENLKKLKEDIGEYHAVYKRQLEKRIEQINDKSKEIGTNGDMFIFITDMHNPYAPFVDKPISIRQNLRAIPLIKKVLECTPCNKVFVGGDLAFSSLSVNNTRELAYNQCRTVVNRFNELIDVPVYFIKGNHDDNGYTDNTYYMDNQLYPLFNACLEKDKDVTWGDRNKLYWYVDNPIAKIRYICLNTFPRKSDGTQSVGAEADQKSWLKNVALNVPDNDWVAVILAHKIHWGIQEIAKEKMDSGVTVAFCLGGHEHRDTFIPYTDLENGKGVNFVQTTCDACYADDGYGRTAGTDNENAFDVVTIDKTQRKIVMYRIGAGDIRSFDY